MKALLIIAVCTLAITGCKTKYVATPERHTRDSLVLQWQHDSVFLHDSVFQTVFTRGDTVFSEKYIRRDLYREVLRTDTLRINHRDTLYLRNPSAQAVADGVDSEPAWYYRAALRFTIMTLLAMVAIAVAWLLKRKKT